MIFSAKCLEVKKNTFNFASLLRRTRAFSSAGSEHLPYKQRVGGSNPSTPTKQQENLVLRKATDFRAFSSAGSEHLPYKQRVGGSNPSTPTTKLSTSESFFCAHPDPSRRKPYKRVMSFDPQAGFAAGDSKTIIIAR